MWNTVLFDLDGTLTDSGEGITKSVQYALEKGFGMNIEDPDELRSFVGPPLHEQFMRCAGLDSSQADEAVRLYRERYTGTGMYENSVYEGVKELLRALKKDGLTVVLASSKPEVFCRQILEHFGLLEYFDLICGSGLDGSRSDKAELIRECLKQLGMENRREEAVIVGDREYDIIGAKQAGIGSIGVTYGYGSREELEAVWPDCICDSAFEVRNVLIGQARDEGRAAGFVPYMRVRERDGMVVDLRKTGSALTCDGPVIFRVWRCVYPLLLDFLASTAISVMCGILLSLFLRNSEAGAPMDISIRYAVLITLVADSILLPLFITLHNRDEAMRRFAGAEAFRILVKKTFTWKHAAFCAAAAIFVSGPLELLVALFASGDTAYDMVEEMLASPGIGLQIVAVGIIGPIMEEYLFRGVLYRRLRDYVGVRWAVLLSSIIFGIAHGNLTQGFFAGAFGILLALLYEHYGTLKASCAAHIGNNLFSVICAVFLTELPAALWILYYLAGLAVLIWLIRRALLQKNPVNVI